MAQEPRIVFSPLFKKWYVVTRYRVKGGINTVTGEDCTYIVATTKHDVTDQMDAIIKAVAKNGQRERRPKQSVARAAGKQKRPSRSKTLPREGRQGTG